MKRLACAIILTTALAACAPPGRGGPSAARSSGAAPTAGSPAAPPPAAVRPQNGSSVWTTPAAGIPTSPRSADWADRYARYADQYDGEPALKLGLDAASNDYSVPVYDAAQATTRIRAFQRPVGSWHGTFDIGRGDTIPWNPAWLPADGNDGHMVILDSRTGEELDLWAVSTPTFSAPYLNQVECATDLNNVLAGYNPGSHLCAAAVMQIREPSGAVADVRTYRGNYPASTEVGVQNSAGLTTPQEVASGVIPHALRMAVSPAVSMSGPTCPVDVTGPDDPRVGTTCGMAVAPAGKFEGSGTSASPAQLSKMVPRGTRVVLDITDAQIDQWLDSRGYTGKLRTTARTFAVALRDYGMIQTMTTGGPWTIPVSGGRNAQTAAGWRSLGIADDGSQLLDGLVPRGRLRVLEPPTNHCNGVPTQLACWSSDTSY